MKNKYILICFLYLGIGFISSSYSQNWLWAKGVNSSGNTGASSDGCNSICTDKKGNAIISGYFSSPHITFGSTTFNINQNSPDLFIAKYDANGNVLWAKNIGGAGNSENSVSTDSSGNIFLIGTASHDSITFGFTTLINSGMFIAKYDSNGNGIWAKAVGNSSLLQGGIVCTDKSGSVFASGTFYGSTMTIGTIKVANPDTSISKNSWNLFIAKYDSDGNLLWAKCAGWMGNAGVPSMSTDLNGNVFISGFFDGTYLRFDSITLTNLNPYFADAFIAKYDANGSVLWAKNAGGTGSFANSVSADAEGNVFVTGRFDNYYKGSSTIILDTITLVQPGNDAVFIAKYDANGNVIWARSAGGSGISIADEGWSISTNIDGSVFATGTFDGPSITFGSITLVRPPGSAGPLFLVKYDGSGNLLCASALAGGGGSMVSTDLFGNAYLGGFYGENPFIVGKDTLQRSNIGNIFVAKYNCDNTLAVNEIREPLSVSVFPNPNNGTFTIKSTSEKEELLRVFDGGGRIVLSHQFIGNIIVDAINLSNGIYNVCVSNNAGVENKRLVIVR